MKLYKYLIGLLMLSASSFVLADVFYINTDDLAKHAHDIVEGKVIKIEQMWDQDHRLIYTYITVHIDKSWKNRVKTQAIVIIEAGGQLDGYVTFSPARAVYRKNEEVMVFLQKDANYYRTYGLNQGKFNVEIRNGKKILTRNINVDELVILGQRIKRKDIKHSFEYIDIEAIITNNLGP